jgi:hypothetical protein
MNMTDNAQDEAAIERHNKSLSRFANLELIINKIERGSPEHAEYIAEGLNLPSPPPIPIELQLAQQRELASVPALERHQRKCAICSHPDRAEIEELFLHWHNPWNIATGYKVPARSLYRHAHATGLYAARQDSLRPVLDPLLERVADAKISGDCIIRAVRAYSCLGGDNKWTEPPARVVYSFEPRRPDQGRRPEQGRVAAASKGLLTTTGAPIEAAPKKRHLPRATRRKRKPAAQKQRILIDTEAIRT